MLTLATSQRITHDIAHRVVSLAGKAFSRMYSFMGIAIIASPLIASRLSARGTYKAAIALAFVQLFTDQFMLHAPSTPAPSQPPTRTPTNHVHAVFAYPAISQ